MLFIVNSAGVPSVSKTVRVDSPNQILQSSLYSPIAMPAKVIAWAMLAKKSAWANAAKDSFCRAPLNGNSIF